jgi:hypothetical protein
MSVLIEDHPTMQFKLPVTTPSEQALAWAEEIPPALTWDEQDEDSKELCSALEAIGFKTSTYKLTITAMAPKGWTQDIVKCGDVEWLCLYDQNRNLRIMRQLSERFGSHIRLGTCLRLKEEAEIWTIRNKETETILFSSKSHRRAVKWIKRHFPDWADPSAYWGETEPRRPWWKLWN